MPARQEWIHSNGAPAVARPSLAINLTDEEAVGMGQALFDDFDYTADNLRAAKRHLMFGNGARGCVVIARALVGDNYCDSAALLRDDFSARLSARVGLLVHNDRAAGFRYDLALEACA